MPSTETSTDLTTPRTLFVHTFTIVSV